MTDGASYIIKRPEHPDLDQIILAENKDALAQFLDQPLAAIAEAITGALAAGPKSWAVFSGKLVQAALKGKLFQQLSREIKELREKGKIADDFAEKPYGYQTWSELMMIIDSEAPDQERLDALKAMFFAVNRVNADDGQRIVAYQLFQIAKKLSSGQLLYLKACYDIYTKREFVGGMHITEHDWLTKVGRKLGHAVLALLRQDEMVLAEMGLVTGRANYNEITNENDARMTDLGIKFCQEIQNYHLEALERAAE